MPIARPAALQRPLNRRRSAFAVMALLALSAATITACAQPPREDVAPSALPDGVTASLRQLRGDVALRQAQLEVRNDTDQAIRIGDVAVSDPRFADIAARVVDRETSIPAGGTVDIRVQLPEMLCEVTEGAPSVQLMFLERGFDDLREGPAEERLDFVAQLHERECRRERLEDAASIAWTRFEPSAPGAASSLELTITPTGDGTAAVTGIEGTNLLDFGGATSDGGVYPVDVRIEPGSTDPIVVRVPVEPFRCDPHAVQEDKRGTIFDVRVIVDGEPGEIELFVGEDMRGAILTWVSEWCGFGG